MEVRYPVSLDDPEEIRVLEFLHSVTWYLKLLSHANVELAIRMVLREKSNPFLNRSCVSLPGFVVISDEDGLLPICD